MLKGVFEHRATMKIVHHLIIRSILALAVACLATPARAQLVPDGGTNIVDGVFADGGVTNYIGSNAPFSLLVITNGGGVTNVNGIIGSTTNSVSNLVVVTGAGSYWSNRSRIFVGNDGSFNTLLITNGATLANSNGYIGFSSNAYNNQVTVTGTNSVWINSNLWVGSNGSFNTLIIARGGQGVAIVSQIGTRIGANNNQVTVEGANAVWTNSSVLTVGSAGSFNTLLVSDGGRTWDLSGIIGSAPGANNNNVTVTGTNSVWFNRGGVYVGNAGSSNTLLITNGGAVHGTPCFVGFNHVSSNNMLSVENGMLTVTNGGGGVLYVLRGAVVINLGVITADQLALTNITGTFTFNAGVFNVRTSAVANGQAFVIGNGSNAATFNAVGNGTHTFADGLLIQTNATLSGTGTINGSVTNCGTIFLTNADQMIFTGPVLNKGVIIAVTGTPRFGSTFTNFGTLITTASINVANVSVSGDDIVLQFNSVSNYLHEVQASTNVSSGLWQSLTNGLLGTGSPITFTDPGGALSPNRTYRVLLH